MTTTEGKSCPKRQNIFSHIYCTTLHYFSPVEIQVLIGFSPRNSRKLTLDLTIILRHIQSIQELTPSEPLHSYFLLLEQLCRQIWINSTGNLGIQSIHRHNGILPTQFHRPEFRDTNPAAFINHAPIQLNKNHKNPQKQTHSHWDKNIITTGSHPPNPSLIPRVAKKYIFRKLMNQIAGSKILHSIPKCS